ncbi:alcohol dehydrogenase catalytic domain-containing protein [Leptospira idonii]|uniref:Threonine dehydrogenase n=1 Tax=Leptospira idonii TaxID=1193500 RepID=A0A4R9LYP7_9LEPT|nr:alcohol dehydrogenase catalytic domain-containing protein [Leptospira idonii]TGN17100.1 threonine dehydrogenase [Leptospira idonii]
MQIKFKAFDYTSDDTFEESEYEYSGSQEQGWEIRRNGSTYLHLGPGYKVLKTKACGVCSTDIDRRFLPHPLPQIIGHEVLAESIDESPQKQYVVEINDTYEARGDRNLDSFCLEGIPTHSPERKVLGIDRLPGGFGPYILAPQHAAIDASGISSKAAVLMEPFAAALQAILASPPQAGDHVAVLGPRRLGSLILAALRAHKQSQKVDFRITAITRHDHLVALSKKMGADDVIDLRVTDVTSLENKFDILYDTTSTASGFESAVKLAKRELHLKTTNGQVMGGLKHLTELVVDELSLLPADAKNLDFHWPKEKRSNQTIFVFSSVASRWKDKIPQGIRFYEGNESDAERILASKEFEGKLPRFDLVIAGSPDEIGKTIRPNSKHENAIVRPRSAILVDTSDASQWSGDAATAKSFFDAGKVIRSSRCGDFHYAIKLLKENPDVVSALEENMVSHHFNASDLPSAYSKAKEPSSVKVVVNFED